MLKAAFRADASLQIGSGHVMRCLTLAQALRRRGVDCHFICRTQPGDLCDMITDQGFTLHRLPAGLPGFSSSVPTEAELSHAAWLGCSWQDDAADTRVVLDGLQPDWLITDHYAIDARWHTTLASHYRRLLAIDDLADRCQQCDVLMDQTFSRKRRAYQHLVSQGCRLLCGSRYALLRPEFAALREDSLQGRQARTVRRLLITLGGVDKDNTTGRILRLLASSALPSDCEITVVMGVAAPWLDDVRTTARALPWPTQVLVDIRNMAAVMSHADLCIGAAGSTAWERCTLGLPAIMVVTADNQRDIAHALNEHGAALSIGHHELPDFEHRLLAAISLLVGEPTMLATMSHAAASVTDGRGAELVADILVEKHAS